MCEDEARGDPVPLQAQFIGSLRMAPFTVRTACIHQNRTTAFWRSEILQARADGGAESICAHATVTLSGWRDTFTLADARMPVAPPASALPPAPPRTYRIPEFLRRYDYRLASHCSRTRCRNRASKCVKRIASPPRHRPCQTRSRTSISPQWRPRYSATNRRWQWCGLCSLHNRQPDSITSLGIDCSTRRLSMRSRKCFS